MNYKFKILLIFVLLGFLTASQSKGDNPNGVYNPPVIIQQVKLDPNNIESWIINTGIFNQDLRTSNTPGFQWPRGSNKFAVFTSGLTLAAIINGSFRIAAGSYRGEYAPGYVTNQSGIPTAYTDNRFKIYKVSRTDNWINNPDWLNWGLMVPYGAPFIDVNHNGTYEATIDTPGIRGALQTLYVCLTDGFPEEHKIGEGFCGGTAPMYAEVHMTAWGFDIPGLEDIQFIKWDIVNKNIHPWNHACFGLYYDPDLGCPDDDYVGCDSAGSLGFCYNADNDDNGCSNNYGINPPAFGIKWLNCYPNSLELKSFVPVLDNYTPGACSSSFPCYNILKGYKNDGSWWLNPKVTQGSRKTKFVFSGGAESSNGWKESDGIIDNCGGDTTGNIVHFSSGDRRIVMASGGENFTLNPNQSKTLMIAQFMAQGSNNLNSVTRLIQLSSVIQVLCDSGFIIGVNNISTEVPNSFILYQNYPNPFNPVTKIKFSIPPSKGARGMNAKLVVYDVLGREVAVLINKGFKPGTYEADWDATNYPSGVYFYKLSAGNFSETKKMVLMK